MRKATRVTRAALVALFAAGIGVATLMVESDTVYSHTPITTKIVFQREIARIFQKKCFQCHTPGNLAMSLTTYKEARPWAVAIKEEILERRMPPWSAVSGYGHFANDMSLTGREVSLILAWADGGAPSGVLLADESKPPVFVPPLNAWEQGVPDAILEVAPALEINANAKDQTSRVEINTALAQPKWLRALQLKPADRRVVRYAAVYLAGTGQWIGTWTPGHQPSALPSGVGLRLPARAKLIVELGYRSTEEPAAGGADLGLYFSETRPAQVASSLEVTPPSRTVATGQSAVRVRGEITLKSASTTAVLWPMLGPGGKSLELTAIRPDGVVEPMLWLRAYRPDWPSPYVLLDPVTLPAGTRLVVTAYYDNAGDAVLKAQPSVAIMAWAPSLPAATPAR